MSIAKRQRRVKRQMGQFLTPEHLAKNIIAVIDFHPDDKVLEPSLGAGAFIFPLIERFMGFYTGTPREKVLQVLQRNLYGVELDEKLLTQCRQAINQRWGEVAAPNFVHGDFLQTNFTSAAGAPLQFDWVVGNPPFGGTLDARHEDALDKKYGMRAGAKIKKETYSFFIVKSLEALRPTGRLHLICSDTFLTINTMKGLRNYLRSSGKITVKGIQHFSGETAQKTVLLTCHKGPTAPGVTIDDNFIAQEDIQRTPNHSWGITPDLAKYFSAQTLGDFMIASSGMTVGKNELFIRKINAEMIAEPYDFNFHERPITLQGVTARARLGKITAAQEVQVREQEAAGETERVVVPQRKAAAQQIKIPHRDYCYYNKAQKGVVYAPPAYVIFWRQAGDAVYTYKKTGNWYLRGVGGQPYFFREGLTWNLIATRMYTRWLPAGYVLDSGAPCAFLRPGIAKNEMFFILAWTLSDLCTKILKTVINHTKNIQGKDFERLPYPFWVPPPQKQVIIRQIKKLITTAQAGQSVDLTAPALVKLNALFAAERYFSQQ